MKDNTKTFAGFLKKIALVSVLVLLLFVTTKTASAAVRDLNGWAWSSNTGWLSFNCLSGGNCATSNYKVTVDDDKGYLDGYAWSSAIGWVSFKPSDVTGCSSGSATGATANQTRAQIDFVGGTGKAVGWARALVATGDPYWNGCISLSDSQYHPSPDTKGDQGVTYDKNSKLIKGFAWGSNVIGWLRFLDVLCTTCQTVVPPTAYNFYVQANSAEMLNTPGSRISVPVNVTKSLPDDVGVSNITVSGLPANVTASWEKNGTPVTGNPTCTSTAGATPTAAGACSFSLVFTAGATAPAVGEYDLVVTATSNNTSPFSRSDTMKLKISDIPGSGRDFSVSLSDVTMSERAGSTSQTPVILTRLGSIDVGIANVVINSGLPSGINVVPRWYRNGALVDPRSCTSTVPSACQFTLQFTAEPGNATVGQYNLAIVTTSTGSPVITKTTYLTLTVTRDSNPSGYGLGIDASGMVLNKATDVRATTPVTVVKTSTINPGLNNITVAGVPNGLTIAWLKNGLPVAGARTCTNLDPGACQFEFRLNYSGGPSGVLPAKGVYPITFTATSQTTPAVTSIKTVTLEVLDVDTTPGVEIIVNDRFYSSSANVKVLKNSKNNVVEWKKKGSGTFDGYRAVSTGQSGAVNAQWSRTFDGTYTSYRAEGVTISEKTTFKIEALNASGDVVDSDNIVVDVYTGPDFREF